MKLDYGTMISPYPIQLTIGTINKPTLGQIADQREIGFDVFGLYESFLVMTPEEYYKNFDKEGYETVWSTKPDEEKVFISMYSLITENENLQNIYTELFNLFFEEPVIFRDGFFFILKPGTKQGDELTAENVVGIISDKSFQQVIDILKQICGMHIDNGQDDISQMRFKNERARKMFERMQRAKMAEKKEKQNNPDFSLPNIISAVCARHPSINYTNVYQLTVYQLLDLFDRMRIGEFYDIDSTRVSVWGDEKKTFKPDSWYKNEYDSK